MDFKLDENFGRSVQSLLREEGHNCSTVRDENLAGSPDEIVLAAACAEKRVLLTMDRGLGNVLRYPPEITSGIVIINPPGRASMSLIRDLIRSLLEALHIQQVQGKLWIVEPGRIRVREPGSLADEER